MKPLSRGANCVRQPRRGRTKGACEMVGSQRPSSRSIRGRFPALDKRLPQGNFAGPCGSSLVGMLKLRLYVGRVKTPVLHIVVQLLIRGDSGLPGTVFCMPKFPVKLRF